MEEIDLKTDGIGELGESVAVELGTAEMVSSEIRTWDKESQTEK